MGAGAGKMVSYRNVETPLTENNAGYALIELLVVVAVVALLVVTIISPAAKWIDFIRLRQGARELAATLRLLQNRALVEERTFHVRFVLRGGTRWGLLIKQTDDAGFFESDQVYKPLPAGITVTYFSELMFHPTGAPSKGLTIRLANPHGREIEITVVPATGRVKVKEKSN